MEENDKEREVTSISEFMQWVKDMHQGEDYTDEGGSPSIPHKRLYYRGQADKAWNLEPSLFRDEYRHVDERRILHLASLRLWNEVNSFTTNLEKLIYFQHYGLCTRLLDVTYNPLIALHMACCEKQGNDNGYGLIFCGYKDDLQNPIVSEKSADYLFYSQNDSLEHYLKSNGENVACNNIDSFSRPTFILPPVNNPRIEAQDGAFIMMPVIDRNNHYLCFGMNLNDSVFFDRRRAKIPNRCKYSILSDLSELGINRGSIYKDPTSIIKSLVEESQMRYGDNISTNNL